MNQPLPLRIKTISEYHQVRGLPKPEHPLISVLDLGAMPDLPHKGPTTILLDFYSISLKRSIDTKYKYGQLEYDFDEGLMFFMAPNQVFGIIQGEQAAKPTGWLLLVHPDFFWNTHLAGIIRKYEFFDYSVHEALFLSDKEEGIIVDMMKGIKQEYHSNIDKFTQDIIISQLATLLNYAERFYHRQFITRKIANHQVLNQLETLLEDYFAGDELFKKGLPTVEYVSDKLNMSPNYLRGLLKTLTGLNTQQHIHQKVIDKAKEKLSITNLSVSEIAYELGFEHPQSFSKLFKNKTQLSPLEFRKSFS